MRFLECEEHACSLPNTTMLCCPVPLSQQCVLIDFPIFANKPRTQMAENRSTYHTQPAPVAEDIYWANMQVSTNMQTTRKLGVAYVLPCSHRVFFCFAPASEILDSCGRQVRAACMNFLAPVAVTTSFPCSRQPCGFPHGGHGCDAAVLLSYSRVVFLLRGIGR